MPLAGFLAGATYEQEGFQQRTPDDLLTSINRALWFAEGALLHQGVHRMLSQKFRGSAGRLVLFKCPDPASPGQGLDPASSQAICSDQDARKQQLRSFAACRAWGGAG